MDEQQRDTFRLYVRNTIFGIEDSLVSTVGLLSGVAVAGLSRGEIVTAGIILIFVEAISMAAGSFLSEQSSREYDAHGEMPASHAVVGGVIMFFSYFLSGFVPLTPYFFLDVAHALPYSIVASGTTLFLLGFIGAYRFGINAWRGGIRMLVIGGAAIAVGIVVGHFVPSNF